MAVYSAHARTRGETRRDAWQPDEVLHHRDRRIGMVAVHVPHHRRRERLQVKWIVW